jgi:hypothetical protein
MRVKLFILVLVLGLAAALPGGAGAASATLSWPAPRLIDRTPPFSSGDVVVGRRPSQ